MSTNGRKWLVYLEITALIVLFFILGQFVWWFVKLAVIILLGFVAYIAVKLFIRYRRFSRQARGYEDEKGNGGTDGEEGAS